MFCCKVEGLNNSSMAISSCFKHCNSGTSTGVTFPLEILDDAPMVLGIDDEKGGFLENYLMANDI